MSKYTKLTITDNMSNEILTDYDSYYGNVMTEIADQLKRCGSHEALCAELDAELDDDEQEHDYGALVEWCRTLV